MILFGYGNLLLRPGSERAKLETPWVFVLAPTQIAQPLGRDTDPCLRGLSVQRWAFCGAGIPQGILQGVPPGYPPKDPS